MQIGAEIRVSVAEVDSDLLLSQYWSPSTFVHRGSCSETDFPPWRKRHGHGLKNTDGLAWSP